jgi:hypothetical protein
MQTASSYKPKRSLARYVRLSVPLLAVILAAMQLVTCSTANPPTIAAVPVSPEVRLLLRRACYDCHSNETVWPWYSRVAPMSWLVHRDVTEGRHAMNFSEWTSDPAKRRKLEEKIGQEVESGDMPLWFYLPLHPAARLSANEKQAILDWVKLSSLRIP